MSAFSRRHWITHVFALKCAADGFTELNQKAFKQGVNDFRYLHQMNGATEISPGLFVGSDNVASDRDFFLRHNICKVVNCTLNVPNYFTDLAHYIQIRIGDSSSENTNSMMSAALPKILSFIASAYPSPQRGVLIHCNMGVSRSCTVAAAYVRMCCMNTINDALDHVLQRRPQAFFYGRAFNFLPALYNVFGG